MEYKKAKYEEYVDAHNIHEFIKEADQRIRSRDRVFIDEVKSNKSNLLLTFTFSGILINTGILENDKALVIEGIIYLSKNLKALTKQTKYAGGAYYNLANGYLALFEIELHNNKYYALFNKTELENAKKNYLKALNCEKVQSLLRSQIWVNLGNTYDHTGRVVDALDCYDSAIAAKLNHGMAYANKGLAMFYFAKFTKKQGGRFLKEAYLLIKKGLEYGVNREAVPIFQKYLVKIEKLFRNVEALNEVKSNSNIAIKAKTKFEGYLINFCLKNRLYLNICSFCQKCDQAIGDPETIEKLITPIRDEINGIQQSYLFSYINQIKQDFITARFLFVLSQYRGININFVDKKVRLIDTLEYRHYNIRIELLKTSFICFYNVLDKIACFIKDYLKLEYGSKKEVYFSDVWYKEMKSDNGIQDSINKTKNYLLNGLYNIHRDIEKGPQQRLKEIRHKLTHSFLDYYWMAGSEEKKMTEKTMIEDTHEIARVVRNAVIYLLKMVYVEETKKEKNGKNNAISMFMMDIPDKLKNMM